MRVVKAGKRFPLGKFGEERRHVGGQQIHRCDRTGAWGSVAGSLLPSPWLRCGNVKIAPACRTCERPRCVASCKRNAIRKERGSVVIDATACVECGGCARACP